MTGVESVFLVLLAVQCPTSLWATTADNLQTFSTVIDGAKTYFNTNCVFIIGPTVLESNYPTVKLLKELSRMFVSSAMLNRRYFLDSSKELINSCTNPIITNADFQNTETYLEMLSERKVQSSVVWFLFMDDSNIDAALAKVDIPFDSEFIVAGPLSPDGQIRLTEVYRVSEHQPLQTYPFGFWSLEAGFTGPSVGFYERRCDLHGLTLNTTVGANDEPMTYIIESGVDHRVMLGGYSGAVWSILERALNFTSKHRLTEDASWSSRSEQGEWRGLIGDLVASRAHVTGLAISTTSDRAQAVAYTTPLYVSTVGIYVREPSGQPPSVWALLSPLSGKLWLMFSLCFLMLSTSLAILFKLLHDRVDERQSVTEIFLQVFGAMFCQQGMLENPRSISKRVVIFLVHLIGLIVLQSYSSSIISSVSTNRYSLPFTTIQEILADGTYTLGVKRSEMRAYEFLKAKGNEDELKVLYDRHIAPDLNNTPLDFEEGLMRLCKGNYGLMGIDIRIISRRMNHCLIKRLPIDVLKTSKSYAFTKTSPYVGLFNSRILRLRSSGIMRKLFRDAVYRLIPPQPETTIIVGFEEAVPILSVGAAGLAASVLVLFVEILTFYVRYTKDRYGHLGESEIEYCD